MTSSRLVREPNARFTGVGAVVAVLDGSGDDRADRAHIGEVPALEAVTIHREGLAVERGGDERRHHRGVGVAGRLERTEHVEEAERKGPQTVAVLPGQGVLLGGELADGVGADRLGGEALVLGSSRFAP